MTVKFQPYLPTKAPRRIVFIVDANTSLLELCDERGGTTRYDGLNGVAALLALKGAAVYSLVQPKQLILFRDARYWKVIVYHGRPTRLIFRDTVTIYAFAPFGPDPQAIMPFFDAMDDLGVSPFSLGTMASHSWRRTLPYEQWIQEWGNELAGRRSFVGGRKEAKSAPANYEGAHYLDLRAAYVSAMDAPLPLHIRESKPEWCDDGICYASVRVPEQPWHPLPKRVSTGKRGTDFLLFGYGYTQGYFVVSELRNAVENFGVEAELIRVWQGYLFKPIFSDWVALAMDLRQLPGAAGKIAKQMTVKLWAIFAANPKWKLETVLFLDRRGREREVTARKNGDYAAKTTFLSSLIASRVRVQLLNELTPNGAVYVDTDGGILPRNVLVPGWDRKRVMDRVEIRAAQAYRWRCPDCGISHNPSFIPEYLKDANKPQQTWHYSIAGVPKDNQFSETWWQAFGVRQMADIGPTTVAIPAMPFSEAENWLAENSFPMSSTGEEI